MPTQRPVRHRCELFALYAADEGPTCNVKVLELSEEGAFVEDTGELPDVQVGDTALLMLALPGGDPLAARVAVVRHGRSRRDLPHRSVHHLTLASGGFGVHFSDLPEDELERLRDYVELLDVR